MQNFEALSTSISFHTKTIRNEPNRRRQSQKMHLKMIFLHWFFVFFSCSHSISFSSSYAVVMEYYGFMTGFLYNLFNDLHAKQAIRLCREKSGVLLLLCQRYFEIKAKSNSTKHDANACWMLLHGIDLKLKNGEQFHISHKTGKVRLRKIVLKTTKISN